MRKLGCRSVHQLQGCLRQGGWRLQGAMQTRVKILSWRTGRKPIPDRYLQLRDGLAEAAGFGDLTAGSVGE